MQIGRSDGDAVLYLTRNTCWKQKRMKREKNNNVKLQMNEFASCTQRAP